MRPALVGKRTYAFLLKRYAPRCNDRGLEPLQRPAVSLLILFAKAARNRLNGDR